MFIVTLCCSPKQRHTYKDNYFRGYRVADKSAMTYKANMDEIHKKYISAISYIEQKNTTEGYVLTEQLLNYLGNCVYTAIGMLLSFNCAVYQGDLINEEYIYTTVDYAPGHPLSFYTNNGDKYHFYNQNGTTNFYTEIFDSAIEEKAFDINKLDYGTGIIDAKNIILNYTKKHGDNFSVNYSDDQKNIMNFIKKGIDYGYPVLIGGIKGKDSRHAYVAYDYDYTNNGKLTFICNTGNGEAHVYANEVYIPEEALYMIPNPIYNSSSTHHACFMHYTFRDSNDNSLCHQCICETLGNHWYHNMQRWANGHCKTCNCGRGTAVEPHDYKITLTAKVCRVCNYQTKLDPGISLDSASFLVNS